jgi:long-chain fatty acid transport protein
MLKFSMAAAVSLIALEASAGGFAVREQSATSQGASFAGAATSAAGLSGMYWNPAVVTEVPGINFDSHYSLILGFAKIAPTALSGLAVRNAPSSGNIAAPAVVPASYGNYQVNDKLFLGISINSPFGLTTKSNFYWAGQIHGRSSRAFNVVATPTIGYKVNDWLSIAAGVQVGYLDVTLKQATGVGAAAPSAILSGDAWGIGYTLGATIKPAAGTEIGIGFRSSVRYDLSGSLGTPLGVTPIKAAINLPEIVTIGLKQQITQQFTMLAGFEWTNWSRVRNPPIRLASNGAMINSLPFFYKDSWMASLGGEYKYNDRWTTRIGFAYEKSPITDAHRSVRIPDNDRIWASVGASYNWNNKLSIDLAYTHIFVKDPNVRLNSTPPNPLAYLDGKGKAHVDIISVGLRYRWDEPSRPVAAAPIVTKY